MKSKEDILIKDAARRKLINFCLYTDPNYMINWHHRVIAQKLQEAYEKVKNGERARIILQVPPRHGKSELASAKFPAWVLGHSPQFPVIATSYAKDLATDFGLKTKDIMKGKNYQALFDTRLRKDATAKAKWLTQSKGGYTAAGVGGSITGKGFKIGIVDDPIKNREEADSEVVRDKIWKWWQSTFITREDGNGAIVVIMCMTGDTMVTMGDGSVKRLDKIEEGDIVLSKKEDKLVKKKVLNHTCQGKDEVFEIKTGNNTIKANKRHPFLTDNGWKKVKDLEEGDKLVCNCLEKHYQKRTLSEDEAWLLGFMFGDGWVTVRDSKNYDKERDTYYPRKGFVTCFALGEDEGLNNKVLSLFKRKFGLDMMKDTGYGYRRTDVARVGRWLTEKGLSGNSHTKRVPNYLFSEPIKIREEFLNGFIKADGHINERNRCSINLCNKGLVNDIRKIARSIGYNVSNINESKRTYNPPNSPKEIEAENYNVQFQMERDKKVFKLKTIRSIEKVGEELVYDLQVEDTGNFLADGIVSHNTRWHEDDLVGRILSEDWDGNPDDWEVIKFPAIATEDEEYRNKGEALWEGKFGLDFLKNKKQNAGPYEWSALYQQNPVDEESREFKDKWIQHKDWEQVEAMDTRKFATIDPGGREEEHDYTGIVRNYVDARNNWHIRAMRVHIGSDELINYIFKLHDEGFEKIGIEETIYMQTLKPFLDKEQRKRDIFPNIEPLKHAMRDKHIRIRGLIPRYSSESVYHITGYCKDLEKEMKTFPKGTYDDTLDALAYQNEIAEPPVDDITRAVRQRQRDNKKEQVKSQYGL